MERINHETVQRGARRLALVVRASDTYGNVLTQNYAGNEQVAHFAVSKSLRRL